MNKKRILKINLSGKKSLVGAIGVMILLAVLMPASVQAGNTATTHYYRAGTSAFRTETRDKLTDSPVHINHKGTVKVIVQVESSGKNCTIGGSYNVGVGETRRLYNRVSAGATCNLYIRTYSGSSVLLNGLWAPDTR
ncbi:hypothetical protein H6B07_18860 [Mediterraneibacter glycyrrhizinilyticus]|nr:hypothetical protein [Mediterraneibacter glycyrrhizinilyticus]MBM6804647.1 hypothetical protein [Mediterraneibacter glycyrrhizinilyticus]